MAARRRSRGSGSVFKTPQGYRAKRTSIDPISKERVITWKRFKTKKEAEEWLVDQQAAVPSSGTRVSSYLKLYERTHLEVLDIAESTRTTRKRLIKNPILPTIGDVTFVEFQKQEALLSWQAHFMKAKRAPRSEDDTDLQQLDPETLLQAFNVFKQILDQAVRDGYTPSNPLLRLNKPRVGNKPDAAFIHWKDVDEKLVPEIFSDFWGNPGVNALTLTLAFTGMRLGEALNLRWRDLNRDKLRVFRSKTGNAQTLKLPKLVSRTLENLHEYQLENESLEIDPEDEEAAWDAYQKGVEVGERLRDPSLPSPTREELQEFGRFIGKIEESPIDDEFIFQTRNGNQMDRHQFYRRYKRLLERAGITVPHRPIHALRHGYAMRLLEKDHVNIAVVSSLMGHNNIRTTINTYGHMQVVAEGIDLDEALDIPEHVEAEATAWQHFG